MSPRGRWALALLIAVTSACAGPAAPELSFRPHPDAATALVLGRVLAPAALLSPERAALDAEGRLAEQPLAAAAVELVDAAGAPVAGVAPTATDARGAFRLAAVPRGEPAFLRVSFIDAAAAERRLYAYVRPTGEAACVEISLPSSFVAEALQEEPPLLPLVQMPRLAPIVAQMRQQLPGMLSSVPADGRQGLLATLASSDTPGIGQSGSVFVAAAGGSGPPSSVGLPDLIAQVTTAVAPVATAVDASVEIEYEVQSIGSNAAPIPGQDEGPHVMAGRCEVLYRAGAMEGQRVTFYLNNSPLAPAAFSDRAWRTTVDTRTHPDGPHVLSAVVETPGTPHPEIHKAFVYLKNAEALADVGCEVYDQAILDERSAR